MSLNPATSSAHVCTAGAIPTIIRNDIWIVSAAEKRQSATRLRQAWLRNTGTSLGKAMLDGYLALIDSAKTHERDAMKNGALLHLSAPSAIKLALRSVDRAGASA